MLADSAQALCRGIGSNGSRWASSRRLIIGRSGMFDGKYTLWGGEHSLFTRKLEAMLNYLDVDYEFRLKSEETGPTVEGRLGTHFIPGLQTPKAGSFMTRRRLG